MVHSINYGVCTYIWRPLVILRNILAPFEDAENSSCWYSACRVLHELLDNMGGREVPSGKIWEMPSES